MPHKQIGAKNKDSVKGQDKNVVVLYKAVGETPLECLERFRSDKIRSGAAGHAGYADIPMTYAGRLDPMAEGMLLALVGDECKNKEKYLNLDKEYEVEILFGIDTDTHDVLGRILKVTSFSQAQDQDTEDADIAAPVTSASLLPLLLQKYVGKFDQEYPAYSSKTVAGRALHVHARAGTLPEDPKDWPKKSVEIYSIVPVGKNPDISTGADIAKMAVEKIGKLKKIKKMTGDFRQDEIIADWLDFEKKYGDSPFRMIRIRVSCSSGTYMRSLAKRMGADPALSAAGAIAFSIRRTRIGPY